MSVRHFDGAGPPPGGTRLSSHVPVVHQQHLRLHRGHSFQKAAHQVQGRRDDADKNVVKQQLKLASGHDVWDFRAIERALDRASSVLTSLFSAITIVAMLLCAFSLFASMYTNVYEQTKEIGILRALGLTNFRIFKLYVYESLILVLSASTLGSCIGGALGFTMTAQQSLFLQLPISFRWPTTILVAVCLGALFVALISSIIPIWLLSELTVTEVMRII